MSVLRGQGGKFAGSTGNGGAPSPAWLSQIYSRYKIKPGTMGFDSKANHGTGYGHGAGDPRVRKLQQALNALGIRDSKGRPLSVDGQLGPLTTQAVKAAQQELGLKPDGVVTPQLLAFIVNAAPAQKASAKMSTKSSTAKKPAAKPAAKAPAKPAPSASHSKVGGGLVRFE